MFFFIFNNKIIAKKDLDFYYFNIKNQEYKKVYDFESEYRNIRILYDLLKRRPYNIVSDLESHIKDLKFKIRVETQTKFLSRKSKLNIRKLAEQIEYFNYCLEAFRRFYPELVI